MHVKRKALLLNLDYSIPEDQLKIFREELVELGLFPDPFKPKNQEINEQAIQEFKKKLPKETDTRQRNRYLSKAQFKEDFSWLMTDTDVSIFCFLGRGENELSTSGTLILSFGGRISGEWIQHQLSQFKGTFIDIRNCCFDEPTFPKGQSAYDLCSFGQPTGSYKPIRLYSTSTFETQSIQKNAAFDNLTKILREIQYKDVISQLVGWETKSGNFDGNFFDPVQESICKNDRCIQHSDFIPFGMYD